ncbi:MAG: transcription termination factor NusA [Patescibacteria group bacterium]
MFDLKVINSVIHQLEEERGIPKEKTIEAVEVALATAYKKEYGSRGQIIKTKFDPKEASASFYQIKVVVDEKNTYADKEEWMKAREASLKEKTEKEGTDSPLEIKELFNPEHHIWQSDAQKIKKGAMVGDEMIFPLESKHDFGRIASQTAKQVIVQKIREAEKIAVLKEYGEQEGGIISGIVQRTERGNIFIDIGKATGIISFEDQIPGERYAQGERIRAYLFKVEENARWIFLRLTRSNPKFLEKLFELEVPEIASGVVTIKNIAREAGSRTKIAVSSSDEHVDPVGSMVGQRGVRVSTVMSELGGEKIDIIEWSANPKRFVEDALSPAKVVEIQTDEAENKAIAYVTTDQQSLAIGRGGQNVRLAAKLTGWKIDIRSVQGDNLAEAAPENAKKLETEIETTKTPAPEQKEKIDAKPIA